MCEINCRKEDETKLKILQAQNDEMRLALEAVRGAFLIPSARAQLRGVWNEYHEDAYQRTMKIIGTGV